MRLICLIQIKKGLSSRKLSELYYKSHSRICSWVNNFNRLGIEGLKNKPKSGRPSRLSQEQKTQLKAILLNNKPTDYGYNTATWNGPLLIDFIKNNYAISYKKVQIYNIIKSLGLTFQKGKAKYFEADEQKREDFKTTVKKNFKKNPAQR